MKKQYCIAKYVMAENVYEALKKAKKVPITEVYVHGQWLDKEKNHNFFESPPGKMGFEKK